MRTQPIPLVGGSYADETRPWSQQDTVNLLPCTAEVEGTRSPSMLKTPPGLKPRVEIVGAPAVRGTYNCEGKLFAVIGQNLYQVSNTGIAIPIGQVPGIGRVEFAHNQISLGNELAVMTGQAGYVYNTVTQTFGRITDPGFPGSAIGLFIDGYIIGIEPQGRYAFNSRPAAATEYNTLDRFTSEVSPDKLIGGAVSNNELLLLSATTGEFFENSGASQQPFRTKRITFDKGCAGPYTVVEADNSVFWLGSDGYFYRLNGYGPVRISKRPLEQAIRGLNWSQAFGFLWEDAGHTVVYWTFPDGRTWGFDAANGQWHRRASYGMNRWRVNSMTRWNDIWIAGDYQQGRLWEMDWDYILEGDDEFISERTIAVIHDHQNRVGVPRIELLMDTGQVETIAVPFPVQPIPPTITGDAPDSGVNVPYPGYAYTLGSGTPPYNVQLRTGALPPNLAITNQGVINTGTPSVIGLYTYSLRNRDSVGLFADLDDTIHILAPWFAISGGNLRNAPDGEDWSGAYDPDRRGNVVFSAAGLIFTFDNSGSSQSWVSDNIGQTWADLADLPAFQFTCACYSGATYLLGGTGGTVLRSEDGATFDEVDMPSNMLSEGGIAAHEGLALCGSYDSIGGNIARSTDDGLTWAGPYDAFVGTGACDVMDICTDGETFLVVGKDAASGRMSKTTSGSTYVQITNPLTTASSPICLCHYADGRWLIANNAGQIAYSTNLTSWTVSGSALGATPTSLDWADGRFIMVGGAVMKSSVNGGATWQAVTYPGIDTINSVTAYHQ